MQENVKGMVKNIQDADVSFISKYSFQNLEDQSNQIRSGADQFRRGASDVESAMKARNRRLNILIICIIVAVLLYILVPIIVWATKD